MKNRIQKIKDWSEIFKNFMEVLAIVIAGVWAYHTFGQKEAPSLEPHLLLSSEIQDYYVEKNTYRIDFFVDLRNNGLSSININKFRIRGWFFSFQKGYNINFIDIDNIQNTGEQFFEKTYKVDEPGITNPFVNHFTPNDGYSKTFQFQIELPENQEWICYKTEFF